jgi:hypothetical protein
MGQGEISGELGVDEEVKWDLAEEVEKVDELDATKAGGEPFTPEEERRLVRKLDFWYVLMLTPEPAQHEMSISLTCTKDCSPHDGNIHSTEL